MENAKKTMQHNDFETLKKTLGVERTTINREKTTTEKQTSSTPKPKKDYHKITTEMYAHRENILKGGEIPLELAQDIHEIIETGNILELLNSFDQSSNPKSNKYTFISKPGKRVAQKESKFVLNRDLSKLFSGTTGVLISATAAVLACVILFSAYHKNNTGKAKYNPNVAFSEELLVYPFSISEFDLTMIFNVLSTDDKINFLLKYYHISYADFENISLNHDIPYIPSDTIETQEFDYRLFTVTFNSLSIENRLNYLETYYHLSFSDLACTLELPQARMATDQDHICFANIYNALSPARKINYMLEELNISYLDFEYLVSNSLEEAQKLGINANIYEVLKNYFSALSLDNRLTFILSETNLSYEEFESIAKSEELALSMGYTKAEYIILHVIYEAIEEAIFNELLSTLNLTYNQFYKTVQGILAEGGAYSYREAFAITTVMLNRTIDTGYINSVNALYGPGAGRSIYYQAIKPGQFQVYDNGSYKKYTDIKSYPGYQAIIDCLKAFILDPSNRMHNYKEFRSNGTTSFSNIMFTPTGNRYDIPLTPGKIRLPEFTLSRTLENSLRR